MLDGIQAAEMLKGVRGSDPVDREALARLIVGVSELVTDFPEMSAYEKSISCAVNADYSRFTAAVSDGDEVAFLPPVSGG